MKKFKSVLCFLMMFATLWNSISVLAEESTEAMLNEVVETEAVVANTPIPSSETQQQVENPPVAESVQMPSEQPQPEETTMLVLSSEEPLPSEETGGTPSDEPSPPAASLSPLPSTGETETSPQPETPEEPEEGSAPPTTLEEPQPPTDGEPTDEQPPPSVEEPVPPTYALPIVKRITLDTNQNKEGFAKIHIALKKDAEDARPLNLIIVPVDDATAQDAAAYLNSHPLAADTFDSENLLHIDTNDAKLRYKAEVLHNTRFIVVGRVEGQLFHSKIHPGFAPDPLPEDPTDPEDPTGPEYPEDPEDIPEPEGEGGEPPPESDGQVYVTPKDDDRDGLFSRTEYRLGLNPNMRDSRGEGEGDFLSIYLQGRLGKEGTKTLFNLTDLDNAEASIRTDLLGEPFTASNHEWALNKMRKNWTSGGPALIGCLDRATTRMVCINNYGVFVGSFQEGRKLQIENSLHLTTIDYPAANKHRFARCFDTTADGKIALLYDRVITEDSGRGGGLLRANAMLIDTATMNAFPIENTEGARDVALSLDGSLVAILREDGLTIWNMLTGEKASIVDKNELSRVEMLAFTEDNLLVVRVTQMGYTAVSKDGSTVLGNSSELGVFVRGRDMLGFDVYDKDHLLLRVDAKLFLASNGIQVTGEDSKAHRLLSQDDLCKYAGTALQQ